MSQAQKENNHAGLLGGLLIGLICLGLTSAVSAESASPLGKPVADAAIGSYVAQGGVSGGIVIAGSDTMQPIVAKIAAAFRDRQPDVKVSVQGGGTDAALRQFLQNQSTMRRGDGAPSKGTPIVAGTIALLAASRPLTESEREDFRSRYGYDVTEIPIALDAIAVYVNRQNPVEGMTLEQLDAIFSQDRKRGGQEITAWGQLGLRDEWAQQPVQRYGQDKRSGTRAIFIHKVLEDGNLRPDVRIQSGPASVILALSKDVLGIGYASIGFQASAVRVLPLAERVGETFIAPSSASVANGTYPLSRSLYLYARKDPQAGLEPAVLEFLKFVNSREGQTLVAKAGAYPLPVQQVAKNMQALTGAGMTASASKTEEQVNTIQ